MLDDIRGTAYDCRDDWLGVVYNNTLQDKYQSAIRHSHEHVRYLSKQASREI